MEMLLGQAIENVMFLPVKILQNIRGNMIYLFRDYIEIPLVGLLHTTGRRFLICKNIKNGNKFCLFLQQYV